MKCTKILLTLVVFALLVSCNKHETPQHLTPHEDSLAELMSKLTGVYQVNVTTESSHAGYPTVIDTLGLKTFTVSKVNKDTIAILDDILPMQEGQSLNSDVIYFIDHANGPWYVESCHFFLPNDSIEFIIHNQPFAGGGIDTVYSGKKLN